MLTQRNPASRLLFYTASALLLFVFVVPYLWMVLSSFKPHAEIFEFISPVSLKTFIPQQFTLSNYQEIFFGEKSGLEVGFGRYVYNTFITAAARVILVLAVNSLIAYALARMSFPGRNVIFILILSNMLIPFETIVVPTYMIVKSLGLQDSYAALVVPWGASPFVIFLLRQFFAEIPRELDEAAIIDGCSHLGVFRHVILPNSGPVLVTAALTIFLWGWDEFFWPLVVMQDQGKQVIQVAIATFTTPEMAFWGRIFAACSVSSVPVLIIFLLLQRYYIRGVVMSGIKG
jgi:multiple sugar transport system permease protein